MSKKQERRRRDRDPATTTRPPDGRIRIADPKTGEDDGLGFWLVEGVAAADIGVDPLREARAI